MKKYTIGVDIGGTLTKVGIVDREGDVFAHDEFPTKGYKNLEAYHSALVAKINELKAHIKGAFELAGLGIGAPNANFYKGTIEYAPNLDWKGIVPFVDELSKLIDLPIRMTNDANAAALGEKIYGGAKDMSDFIVITLGTGLGSGIVTNGKLIYGHGAMAGELGHVVIDSDGRLTGLGRRGGLEAYVSSTGLKRTVFYLLADSMVDSPLRDISYHGLHGEYITELAEKGDPIATEAYKMTGEILGKALADFVAFSQPEAIFLLGGMAKSGKWIFEPASKQMEKSLLPFYQGKVKLLPSGLLNKNAAVLGASALIWEEAG